jgi:hypothetical protein
MALFMVGEVENPHGMSTAWLIYGVRILSILDCKFDYGRSLCQAVTLSTVARRDESKPVDRSAAAMNQRGAALKQFETGLTPKSVSLRGKPRAGVKPLPLTQVAK